MLQDSCFAPGIMALEEAAREARQNICMYICTHTCIHVATVCAELQCCSLSLCMSIWIYFFISLRCEDEHSGL